MTHQFMPRSARPHVIVAAVLVLLAGPAVAQTQDTTYQYQYDANGNLTRITDPLGHVTQYSHSVLGRRTICRGNI